MHLFSYPKIEVFRLLYIKMRAVANARKLRNKDKLASRSFEIKARIIDRKLRALTVNKL